MKFLVRTISRGMRRLLSTVVPLAPTVWLLSWSRLRDSTLASLGRQLSPNASVYLPGSAEFEKATTRWSSLDAPKIKAVVEVATEDDVATVIEYANRHDLPFVAYAGGHGAIQSLAGVENGIEIWLRKLDSISIAADGQTATFGGGVTSKRVIDALWMEGKQTVTSACESTGLVGTGLGGGHGFLQGYYGLTADQFVSMNLVLANGSKVTVDENSDLWWALKGAGHNFGIVTSVTMKIYDVPSDGLWSYGSFLFTHDKVERLYAAINALFLEDTPQPAGLVNYSVVFNNATIDPEHPVIAFFILREGVHAVESTYTDPFTELDPVMTSSGTGTYKNLPEWTGNAETSLLCQKAGLAKIRFPVDLQLYNPASQRVTFDIFSNVTHQSPEFNSSLLIFEGYSVEGVQKIPPDSTAFPHREARVLVAPLVVYEPADPNRDIKAQAFGELLRETLFYGSGQQKLYAYVNYAAGDEAPESWYGYEPWRLQRLRELKTKYDPDRRFRYYAPLD